MKSPVLRTLLFLLIAHAGSSADRVNIAEDDAAHSAYNPGWESGRNSGSGFGAWTLRAKGGARENSHSGFFVAPANDETRIENIAPGGRALGLFANGVDYEAAVAFRTFNGSLQPGDSFSLLMEGDAFVRKFETDDERPGAIGFVLRSGGSAEAWDDYESGTRLKFGIFQGDENYQVFDGSDTTDTGVVMTTAGIAVTVTVVSPDTYDLEITPLDTKETVKLPGRKFGGEAGAPIDSFAIFNVDGESHDAYFNGFQVSRSGGSIGR